MRYISKTDFICTYHRIIIENTKSLLKSTTDERVKELLQEILLSAKFATKSGIKMESRLNKYYSAIEDLGFKRKVKKMEINIYCSICGKIMFIDSYDGEPIQICERCSGKYREEREET